MLLEIAIGIFHFTVGVLRVAADPDAYSKKYLEDKRVVGDLLFTWGIESDPLVSRKCSSSRWTDADPAISSNHLNLSVSFAHS